MYGNHIYFRFKFPMNVLTPTDAPAEMRVFSLSNHLPPRRGEAERNRTASRQAVGSSIVLSFQETSRVTEPRSNEIFLRCPQKNVNQQCH